MDLERWLQVTRNRWRAMLWRRAAEQELADELAYHLEEETGRRVARGQSPADARREVIAAFGGVERRKDECRDVRGFPTLESVLKDVRYGLATLRRQPSFTVVAILALHARHRRDSRGVRAARRRDVQQTSLSGPGAAGRRQRDISGRRVRGGTPRSAGDDRGRVRRRSTRDARRRRPGDQGDGRARVGRVVRGARRGRGRGHGAARWRRCGGPEACDRVEPRVVAVALRPVARCDRPQPRRRRHAARDRRRDACRRSSSRRAARSSGSRSSSIHATRPATGPATSCR